MNSKKAQGALEFEVIIKAILVLAVVVAAFAIMIKIKRVAYNFEYAMAENENLTNEESAYLSFMKGSTHNKALREWIKITLNSKEYKVKIDCKDSSCSKLTASFRYETKDKFKDLNCGGKTKESCGANSGVEWLKYLNNVEESRTDKPVVIPYSNMFNEKYSVSCSGQCLLTGETANSPTDPTYSKFGPVDSACYGKKLLVCDRDLKMHILNNPKNEGYFCKGKELYLCDGKSLYPKDIKTCDYNCFNGNCTKSANNNQQSQIKEETNDASCVDFNNPGLACCGNYLCVFANVDKDYRVSLTPYIIGHFDKFMEVPIHTGFVIKYEGNAYRVNLVNYATPFVREVKFVSLKYYNFLIIDKEGNKVYCSAKRGNVIKTSKVLCNKELPFKIVVLKNLQNGCDLEIRHGSAPLGQLTLTG